MKSITSEKSKRKKRRFFWCVQGIKWKVQCEDPDRWHNETSWISKKPPRKISSVNPSAISNSIQPLFVHSKMGASESTPVPKTQPKTGKSGKKICCSCPETKKLRDECTLTNGPESDKCKDLIEKHKICLRGEGFIVK